MSAITIKDLPISSALDVEAMANIKGGGAPWVYGWIRPYSTGSASAGGSVNFYQINNYADQMINQFQVVEVTNTGANAHINVAANETSTNIK